MADLFWRQSKKPGRSASDSTSGNNGSSSSFTKFEDQTKDAWDCADDELIKTFGVDPDTSRRTAKQVLTRYDETGEPPLSSKRKSQTPTKNGQETTQPELTQVSTGNIHIDNNTLVKPDLDIKMPIVVSPGPVPSSPITGLPPLSDAELARSEKFSNLINVDHTDLSELRKLAWRGIPASYRPICWRLMCGLLPTSRERRSATLTKKRNEYWKLVDRYFKLSVEDSHKDTYHQIKIDIPRTNPSIGLYQQTQIQELMERVLFIWAIRHPASGYVQGLNDLICPFMMVFLSEHVRHGEKFENIDVKEIPEEAIRQVEADCFWCLGWLLDGIQDNYTFAQPGIQRQVAQLDDLIKRIQTDLHDHLLEQGVQFLQFSFRWFNNLLMRELPLRSIVRLWDSYFAEPGPDERSTLHLFTCSAFLIHWKRLLLEQCDFQGLMLAVQGLPTNGWGDSEIAELLAKAFMLRSTYTVKDVEAGH